MDPHGVTSVPHIGWPWRPTENPCLRRRPTPDVARHHPLGTAHTRLTWAYASGSCIAPVSLRRGRLFLRLRAGTVGG